MHWLKDVWHRIAHETPQSRLRLRLCPTSLWRSADPLVGCGGDTPSHSSPLDAFDRCSWTFVGIGRENCHPHFWNVAAPLPLRNSTLLYVSLLVFAQYDLADSQYSSNSRRRRNCTTTMKTNQQWQDLRQNRIKQRIKIPNFTNIYASVTVRPLPLKYYCVSHKKAHLLLLGIICSVYVNYLNYVLVKLFFTLTDSLCIYFVFLMYLSIRVLVNSLKIFITVLWQRDTDFIMFSLLQSLMNCSLCHALA